VPAVIPAPTTLPPPPPGAEAEPIPSSVASVYESAGADNGLRRLRDLLGTDLCDSAGEQAYRNASSIPLPTHVASVQPENTL